MDTLELRNKLHEYVNKADDHVLRIMSAVFEKYNRADSENVVAYTIEGEPLTVSEYRKEIEEAEEQIKRGEYITQEELKREVDKWRK
ncbi:SurA N-terminal domain-containing protein [Phaeocystidibacter luteus]|uniref:Uncharacterized protein n=1 Tax=Phaeocystidibacter luteus TaxID=911197 RepID=A0A6N6RFY4_9FLAO|nr:hypothetical protein [Phaeocystidibacter luteus]KAB2808678.1 hypothetical protein F8C67_10350 [Phaeocystidibacter luteus]